MTQTQMTQAAIQYEAARELVQIVRPAISKLVRSARNLHLRKPAEDVIQPEFDAPLELPTGRMETQGS